MKTTASLHGIKVVFFDLNNTLIDTKSSFADAFKKVLEEFTGRWAGSDSEWNPTKVLNTYQKEWNKLRGRTHAKSSDPKVLLKLKQRCLEAALKPYSFPVTGSFIESFFRRLDQEIPDSLRLFPDVKPVLEKLAKTHKLAVITNGKQKERARDLKRLGLDQYISVKNLFTSGQSGVKKPNQAIFKYALKQMSVGPLESVMVGDSWRKDMMGSSKVGMASVWIRRGSKFSRKPSARKGTICIRSLRQLPGILG